jgi:hypothetical protein
MYILVDAKTNIIVGSAINKVDEKACSKNGQKVYEISNEEYSNEMIGTKIEDFKVDS